MQHAAASGQAFDTVGISVSTSFAAGVPVKVMQERLGHATAQITLDLYSHVIPGMGAEAAVKIAGLLRNAGA